MFQVGYRAEQYLSTWSHLGPSPEVAVARWAEKRSGLRGDGQLGSWLVGDECLNVPAACSEQFRKTVSSGGRPVSHDPSVSGVTVRVCAAILATVIPLFLNPVLGNALVPVAAHSPDRRNVVVLTANIAQEEVGHGVLARVRRVNPDVITLAEAVNARGWAERRLSGYRVVVQPRGDQLRTMVLVRRGIEVLDRGSIRGAGGFFGPQCQCQRPPKRYPWVRVQMDWNSPFALLGVHMPPVYRTGQNRALWERDWDRLRTWLNAQAEPAAVAGDFNASCRTRSETLVPDLGGEVRGPRIRVVCGGRIDHAVTRRTGAVVSRWYDAPDGCQFDCHGYLSYRIGFSVS